MGVYREREAREVVRLRGCVMLGCDVGQVPYPVAAQPLGCVAGSGIGKKGDEDR